MDEASAAALEELGPAAGDVAGDVAVELGADVALPAGSEPPPLPPEPEPEPAPPPLLLSAGLQIVIAAGEGALVRRRGEHWAAEEADQGRLADALAQVAQQRLEALGVSVPDVPLSAAELEALRIAAEVYGGAAVEDLLEHGLAAASPLWRSPELAELEEDGAGDGAGEDGAPSSAPLPEMPRRRAGLAGVTDGGSISQD
ncbi:MAG: hypothetical protein OXH14_03215 [Alphaproteobacteria bacterium]|nr:hypothetical protein [Alphaproteobacteria bacterium]